MILAFICIILISSATESQALMLRMSATPVATAARVNVRLANDVDIPLVARFLSESMYGPGVPNGQRKELSRLELIDLRDRYGGRVGKRRFPSALIIAEEDQEIVGCVGLDCQLYSPAKERFKKVKPNKEVDENGKSIRGDELAAVLSNLAVRIDKRKLGIDERNEGAQKLYKSEGYKRLFRDDEATCVVSGNVGLKTESCVNICFRKPLKGAKGGSNSMGSFFNTILGGMFGAKK